MLRSMFRKSFLAPFGQHMGSSFDGYQFHTARHLHEIRGYNYLSQEDGICECLINDLDSWLLGRFLDEIGDNAGGSAASKKMELCALRANPSN